MLVIPCEDIVHTPKGAGKNNKSKRLVLCDFFGTHVPGSCRAGSDCRWVHATTDRAKQKNAHYSHDWREPSECPHERIKAEEGRTFTILQPTATRGEVPPDLKSLLFDIQGSYPGLRPLPLVDQLQADVVPAELILKTRCVFDDPKHSASHCAHFFYRRECHHGPECDFAHTCHPAGRLSPPEAPRTPPAANATAAAATTARASTDTATAHWSTTVQQQKPEQSQHHQQ